MLYDKIDLYKFSQKYEKETIKLEIEMPHEGYVKDNVNIEEIRGIEALKAILTIVINMCSGFLIGASQFDLSKKVLEFGQMILNTDKVDKKENLN